MKFVLFTEKGRIDKYVSEVAVVTFLKSRNKITVNKRQHSGKINYINLLMEKGYKRVAI